MPECTDRKIIGLGSVSQLSKTSKTSAGKHPQKHPQKHMQKDGRRGYGPIDFLERKLAFARVVAWFLGTAKLGSSPLHFSPLRRPPNGSFSISIAFRCCLPLICFPPFAISISILKTPIDAGQLTFAVLCLYLFAAPPDALARRVSQNSRNRHRLKR